MATTRVTNTKSGKAAIKYAFEEKLGVKAGDRVLAAGGSNLDVSYAMQQMRHVWKAHGKDDGKTVQMYRIIQSFGLDELDPKNPEDIAKANEIGLALAAELYPDRQALVVTQADGKGKKGVGDEKGGKLHNHILVNSVSFVDGKSLRGDDKEHSTISAKSDEIIQRYGMNPVDTEASRNRRTLSEKQMAAAGMYVWKDDLRNRIVAGLESEEITDRDSFVQHMKDEHEVEVSYRGKKFVKYDFIGKDGGSHGARDTALSNNGYYGRDRLDEMFAENAQRLAEAALAVEAEQEEEEVTDEPETIAPTIVGGIDLSFMDADLAKVSKRHKKADAPVKNTPYVEPDMMREVREEREAKKAAAKMDGLHGDALVMNDEVDSLRAKEAAAAAREEAERKAEQEKQKKAEEDARKAIEALEEAKRQEQAEKAQKLREEAKARLVKDVFFKRESNYDVPESTLTRFMQNEEKWMGTKFKNGITKELEDYTVSKVYKRTTSQIADEKRAERNGVQNATDQVAQADGPEL